MNDILRFLRAPQVGIRGHVLIADSERLLHLLGVVLPGAPVVEIRCLGSGLEHSCHGSLLAGKFLLGGNNG